MAVLLYANGLTEETRPKKHTFTDKELLDIFGDYPKMRSFRLYEVPNTWCLWGEYDPQDSQEDEFNKLGTDILEQPCYSPILFVHDTEIDPNLRLTDEMIIMGYEDFRVELLHFFDAIAKDILKERERERQSSGSPQKLMILEQDGVSPDKRIIFRFDIDKQVEEFFIRENLIEFAQKVHKYLKFFHKNRNRFWIYADKNIIIRMEVDQVKPFIEKIIALFESEENYEACSVIRNAYEKWVQWKKENPSPKQEKGGSSKDKK